MVWNSNFDIYPICTRGRLYLGFVNQSQCVGGRYWTSLSRPFHSISLCLCISSYHHLVAPSHNNLRLSFATSGLHLACWKSEDWVRPIICKPGSHCIRIITLSISSSNWGCEPSHRSANMTSAVSLDLGRNFCENHHVNLYLCLVYPCLSLFQK